MESEKVRLIIRGCACEAEPAKRQLSSGKYSISYDELYHFGHNRHGYIDESIGEFKSRNQLSENKKNYSPFTIPDLALDTTALNDPAFADKFNRDSYRERWYVQAYDTAITQRLAGQLPDVLLQGTLFIADGKHMKFIEADNPANSFSYFDCKTAVGIGCEMCYDPIKKNIIPITPEMVLLPAGAVVLRTAIMTELDPVGAALFIHQERTSMLSVNPQRLHHPAAQVLSPGASMICDTIRRNQLSQLENSRLQGLHPRKTGRRKSGF